MNLIVSSPFETRPYNKCDVKTLIEITKHWPKVNVSKIYFKLVFCHISHFSWFWPAFTPIAMETINKSHSLYFVIYKCSSFMFTTQLSRKNQFFLCFILAIPLVFCTHNAFSALVPSCISQPHGRVRHLGNLLSEQKVRHCFFFAKKLHIIQ